MHNEVSLIGLYMPALVPCAVLAVVLWRLADGLMLRTGLWRFFWHQPLARLALFVIIFGLVSVSFPEPWHR